MRILSFNIRKIAILAVVTAISAGCGGDGGPSEPPGPVLAAVEVTPASADIYTTAPGNSVSLSVKAQDPSGATIVAVTSRTFSSDNPGVATVSGDGTVTAASVGTAMITVSVRVGDVTRTANVTVTVKAPSADATVTAPQLVFLPAAAHILAAGTVTWSFAEVPHNVIFRTVGAPADVPEIRQASATRAFTERGTYDYHCSIHPGMVGAVHVH